MRVRRARAAVVVVAGLATVTGVAGCGSSGSGAGAAPSSPVVVVTSELGLPTLEAEDPDTASPEEERINEAAAARGWDVGGDPSDEADSAADDLLGDTLAGDGSDTGGTGTFDDEDAAGLVQDVCDTLDDDSADPDISFSPGQWLGEYGYDADQRQIISYGVSLLCGQWKATVAQAWAGTYPVWISAGTFKVTSRRAADTVPPGRYRTSGDLEGCYWERARADGDIIDNRFATAATSITVTIQASDDLFTSQSCGTWKPVK